MTTPFEPGLGEQTDRGLLAGARSGDEQALEVLIVRHRPWVFNLALRMLFQHADAEDATQEILFKALKGLSSFRGDEYLRGNCSLIEPGNSCKCARKTRAYVQGGFVDPRNLRFTPGHLRKIRDLVEERAGAIREAYVKVADDVFRSHPFYEPSGPVEKLRKVLKELGGVVQ